MNFKLSNILHTIYTVVYILSLAIPIYLIYSPISYYLENNMPEFILGSLFGFEGVLALVCCVLSIVSITQNVKLKRKPLSKTHTNFLITTGIGMILYAIVIFSSLFDRGGWEALSVLIYISPLIVIVWITSIIIGFVSLKKDKVSLGVY